MVLNDKSEQQLVITPLWFGKEVFAFDDNGSEIFGRICSYTFRPLPPEKTKRESAVKEMLEYLPEYQPDIVLFCEQYSQNLYDKGYHNGKKVKPLPSNWFNKWCDADYYPHAYEWLIDNGYCIAEGE